MSMRLRLNLWRPSHIGRCLLLTIVAFVGTGFFVGHYVAYAQAQRSEADDALDVQAYTRVQQVCQELALTNQDMAAMGLTQEQAENVLIGLVQWARENESQLVELRHSELENRQALRDVYQKINVGPRDEQVISELSKLQVQVNDLDQRKTLMLEAVASTVETYISSEQRHIWDAARSHPNASKYVRYASDVSKDQEKKLAQLQREAIGKSSSVRLSAVLTVSQLNEIFTARTNHQRFIAGVLTAEQSVLPETIGQRLLW